MTPLAHYFAKQIIARPKDREHIWREPANLERVRDILDDIHCFEVTGAIPIAHEVHQAMKHQTEERNEALFGTYAFLPAPKTWIEWKHGSGNRIGVFLQDFPKDHSCSAVMFTNDLAVNLGGLSTNSGDYYDLGGERYFPDFLAVMGGAKTAVYILSFAHMMLILINSPKIIGRRQHMPHRGLERRLTRGLGVGKFPLHAWTEILLQVAKPAEIDDGEPHEAHLTGRRALHFCRKHIRIRNGQLEYVSAHWRGDPALGIKRSRYNVVP